MSNKYPNSTKSPKRNDHDVSSQATAEELENLAGIAKEQARRVMQKIPLLGAVGWLMMQQSDTRHTLLSQLEWRVLVPLALDQAKLYMRDEMPVAFASWAFLSEAVAQRYQSAPHQLTNSDWRSGDQIWVVDLIAPFGGTKQILDELRKEMFKGRPVKQMFNAVSGSKVLTWQVGD